ncbi:type II CAAX endopeptidase family protein [Lactobacillaceae bacterium L1_55_11]|nr:type II CAAX endopeptidase family protein [Lactobacillaceae bacterium L1_55_11]
MAQTDSIWHKFKTVGTRLLIFIWYVIWDVVASSFLIGPTQAKVNIWADIFMIVVGLLLYWWFFRSILKRICKVRPDFTIERLNWRNWRKGLLMVGFFLALLFLSDIWMFLTQWLFPHLAGSTTANEAELNKLSASQGVYSQLLMAFYACVIGPVVEELIFRGMFFAYFDRFKNWWIAPILSATAFAAFHLASFSPKDLLDFPVYFPAGLLLAYLYKSSGRISNSIAMHTLNNVLSTILGWLALAFK